MITIDNYQKFAIEYIENTLEPQLRVEMDALLRAYPQLNSELERLTDFDTLTSDDISFDKQILYRNFHSKIIHENNIDEFIIARLEGDLDDTDNQRLTDFIKQNPAVESRVEIIAQTFLKSDKSVVYEGKSHLKRVDFTRNKRGLYISWISAVAMILVLFVVFMNEHPVGILTSQTQPLVFTPLENNNIETQEYISDKNPSLEGTEIYKQEKSSVTHQSIKRVLTPVSKIRHLEKENISSRNLDEGTITPKKMITITISPNQTLTGKMAPIAERTKVVVPAEKYMPVTEYLSAWVKKSILPNELPDKIDFWLIADAGVKGFNKLTENNYTLKKEVVQTDAHNKVDINIGQMEFSRTKTTN